MDYPKFPDGFKVYIEGSCFRGGAVSMFARAGCKAAMTSDEADLVVFLGGEDINPELYGENKHAHTFFNVKRDEREVELFNKCVENKIPMFGICRGMQFIHAMSGGKLYQHVRGHANGDHMIIDIETGDEMLASSMHHQMCIKNPSIIPLAYARKGTTTTATYEEAGRATYDEDHKDLEAAVYLSQRAIAVQGHPECMQATAPFVVWTLRRILDLLAELKVMDEVNKTKKGLKVIPDEIVEPCLVPNPA